ncbi:MAG: transcription-repair coupling factor [Phycisphaerae bacterium]|nr:transcription-repair coupling factor [Phycisphaerae bacterium]
MAPIQALMQPVPTFVALEANSLVLASGADIAPRAVAEWLVEQGFSRLDLVESPGDFALRGGILDVYPFGDIDPVRVEFFGDTIENIRQFDVSTQRSMRELSSVRIASPRPLTADAAAAEADRTTSFLSYLPPEALVVFDEPAEIQELARTFMDRLGRPVGMFPVDAVFRRAAEFTQLHLARFGGASGAADTFRFDVQSVQRFEAKAPEAVAELCGLAREQDVIVYCDNPGEQHRLRELLDSHTDGTPPPNVRLEIGLLHRGFQWAGGRVAVVGHHEIFHRHQRRRRIRRTHAARPIESWLDLEAGDLVVHVVHGIARFRGMRTQRKGKTEKTEEYLTLEFAGQATLHVPASQIDLVQKYVGAGQIRPPLSKLGGTRWKKTKERVEEAVNDLAGDLLKIQALRSSQPGIAYPDDTDWQREFEEAFPYAETEDQLSVLAEIKRDMREERPMDRLLCGDVGYGKTELAIRAAFKATEYGKQVAVLVPTTVLAEQHFQTFRERLADFPFVVESISRFRTKAEQAAILERARRGQVDILIGTHRILSKDVGFADLGLVVIDEEQRFGVDHKERLKRLRETVDVLTLTATPIPRTLHMAMLGIRDISSLATPPMDRRSIVTQVRGYDRQLIHDAIVRELNRDGQVYFVHNFVHDIHSVADEIQQIVPDARIVIGHGQMKEHQLERSITRFVRHEADILVSTNIIESGVDIPNVNTIFINRADRFGLADLHQLRGRVGRYKHRAYCYLLLPPDKPVTDVAAKRLKAIEEYSELGSGFRIAMRDLEIRGAGNILGPEQSGNIADVGYELYCQLLDQAVRRLRDEPVELFRPVHLELDVAAHVPRGYIPSERQRMEVYRRLVACRSRADIEQLEKDLHDAYGPPPPVVSVLLQQAEVRILAQPYHIQSIIQRPPDLVFTIEKPALVEALFKRAPGTARAADLHTVHLRLPEAYFEPTTLLAMLRRWLASK